MSEEDDECRDGGSIFRSDVYLSVTSVIRLQLPFTRCAERDRQAFSPRQ